MKDLLKVLSPKMRDIAGVLLALRDAGVEVAGIWDEAEEKVAKTYREIR